MKPSKQSLEYLTILKNDLRESFLSIFLNDEFLEVFIHGGVINYEYHDKIRQKLVNQYLDFLKKYPEIIVKKSFEDALIDFNKITNRHNIDFSYASILSDLKLENRKNRIKKIKKELYG